MFVKICGLTHIENAEEVLQYKPDFVGVIFAPTSKRQVRPELAKLIVDLAHKQDVQTVGVFANQSVDEVAAIALTTGIDYIQLHGEESIDDFTTIGAPIIRRIAITDNTDVILNELHAQIDKAAYFLIDRQSQGEGPMVDMEKAANLAPEFPIVIAGGLNPENITPIIKHYGKHLKGVDVSSGVEHSVGLKDPAKVKLFIEIVRGTYANS